MLKKHLFHIMALVQIMIIVLGCAGLWLNRRDLTNINIPYRELVGTTIPDDRNGWYIDETFPCLEDGLFDSTNKIALDKGTYNITVNYATDREKNYSTAAAESSGYYKLFADKTPLPSRKNSVTYTIYLLKDVSDFEIKNYYCKEGFLIIGDISINETQAYSGMKLFSLFFLFVLADFIFIAYKKGVFSKISRKRYIAAMLLISMSAFVSMQVFDGFMTESQDCAFHLLRIEGLRDGLRSGQFPVKMQPNWMDGYGYPVSVYYGDLFLYIPAILRLIGFPVQFSYGVFILLINFATAAIAYWCCHKISKDRAVSLASSFLYLLVPYRLTDIYERNALGETIAITFLPLIVYGMHNVLTADCREKSFKKSWIPLVIGFTGIIESHILTCVMCSFFIIMDCIIHWKKVFEKERFIVLAKTVIYTSLLNAGFIFPCITSMKGLDVTAPYRITNRIQWGGTLFVELFRTYNKGSDTVLSLGSAAGIALLLYLLLLIACRKDSAPGLILRQGMHIWIFAILSSLMATMYFPWDQLSDLLGRYSMAINNIQFQFRFLGIASVFVMAVCCFALKSLRNVNNGQYFMPALCAIGITVFISGSYMIDIRLSNFAHSSIYDIDWYGRTDPNVREYLLYGTDFKNLKPDRVELGAGITLDAYAKKYTDITLTCRNASDNESYIEVPLLYYSQYSAKDESGNKMELACGDNNILRLLLPANYQGTVSIYYKQPLFWRICELVSAITFLAMAISAFCTEEHKKLREKKMKKRILLFAFFLLVGLLRNEAVTVYAQEEKASEEDFASEENLGKEDDFIIEDGVLTAYNGSGGAVVIPNGVTGIGNNAFRMRKDITSVIIPESVTSIGVDAFYQCTGLTGVSIPGNVAVIGDWAFWECSNLKDVIIGEGVERIGDGAFGHAAFTKVEIPGSVKEISYGAFAGCGSLAGVIINEGVKSIGSMAFDNCKSLASVEMPESLESIGEYAFIRCASLSGIEIPAGVESIGKGVFAGCSSLANVVLPKKFEAQSDGIFEKCASAPAITYDDNSTDGASGEGNGENSAIGLGGISGYAVYIFVSAAFAAALAVAIMLLKKKK